MTGPVQMQVVSASQWAGRLCIQQSPSGLVPHAKVAYFLASHPWANADFCILSMCVIWSTGVLHEHLHEWMKLFFCPIGCVTPGLPVTLASFVFSQSAPGFLQGLDFPRHCRQASKLAPRHVSWLSALPSLGEPNRCSAPSSLQVSRQGKLAKSL